MLLKSNRNVEGFFGYVSREIFLKELTTIELRSTYGGGHEHDKGHHNTLGYLIGAVALGAGAVLLWGHFTKGWLNPLFYEKDDFMGYAWQGPITNIDDVKTVKVPVSVNHQQGGIFYGKNPPSSYKKAMDIYVERDGSYWLHDGKQFVKPINDKELAPRYTEQTKPLYFKEPIFSEEAVLNFKSKFKYKKLPIQPSKVKVFASNDSFAYQIQAKVFSIYAMTREATGEGFQGMLIRIMIPVLPGESPPEGFRSIFKTVAITKDNKWFIKNEGEDAYKWEEPKANAWPIMLLEE